MTCILQLLALFLYRTAARLHSNSIAHSEKQASVVTIRVNVKISYFLYPLNLLQDFFNQYLNNAKIVKQYRAIQFNELYLTSGVTPATKLPEYANRKVVMIVLSFFPSIKSIQICFILTHTLA